MPTITATHIARPLKADAQINACQRVCLIQRKEEEK